MARLAIPQSLYCFLSSNLGGLRAAREAVMSFQQKVVDAVNIALATDAPFPPPRRPCPFNIADWRVSPPPHRVRATNHSTGRPPSTPLTPIPVRVC